MRNKFHKKQYLDISIDLKKDVKFKKRQRLQQTSSQASFLGWLTETKKLDFLGLPFPDIWWIWIFMNTYIGLKKNSSDSRIWNGNQFLFSSEENNNKKILDIQVFKKYPPMKSIFWNKPLKRR